MAGARTRLDTDRRRAQLLDVGLREFGSRPYDEVSIDDIAQAAGVSRGLVYHYFPDKRRIYLAVLRWVAEQMMEATVAEPSKPSLERLYDGLRAHLAFAEEHAAGYTALMSGGSGNDEEVRALCEEFRWRGLEEIMRSLRIEAPSPALRIALRGWVGFQEGALIEWLKRRDLEREELLDLLAETLGATLALAGFGGERPARAAAARRG